MNVKKLTDLQKSRLYNEHEDLITELDYTPEEDQKEIILDRLKEIREELSESGFDMSELSKPNFL